MFVILSSRIKDTAYDRAGTPIHFPRSMVRLSPDLADITDEGTENMVNVARLFLKQNKHIDHFLKTASEQPQ